MSSLLRACSLAFHWWKVLRVFHGLWCAKEKNIYVGRIASIYYILLSSIILIEVTIRTFMINIHFETWNEWMGDSGGSKQSSS